MKLIMKPLPSASEEQMQASKAYSRSIGFPHLGEAGVPNLAVVGGGNSINDHVDELKAFDGDIWAINGTYQWCRKHGIDAWFYSCDPSKAILPFCEGAKRAMLVTCCHPAVFDALRLSQVEAIEVGTEENPNGPTTACTTPLIAAMRGYRSVSFYGCESSFADRTHAYGNFALENRIQVRCNGQEFFTTLDLFSQAEFLGADIRKYPHFLIDKSGGLLSAYVVSPEIDVLSVTRSIYQALQIEAAHDMGVEELMSKQHRDLINADH